MGSGYRTGFFRVIDEICLHIVVGLFADNGDGIFICANRSVGSETVEERRVHFTGFIGVFPVVLEARAADIVVYADHKMIFRDIILQIIKHSLDHCGGEFLGSEAVAATDDLRFD